MSVNRKYPLPYPTNAHERAAKYVKEAMELNKDPVIGEKLAEAYRLINSLDEYLDETAVEETPIQTKILTDTYKEPWPKHFKEGKTMCNFGFAWASGYLEGQFLRIAAQMTRAKRILEVGMFTGYGAVSFAESKHCEEMVCLDIDPFLAKYVKDRVAGTPLEPKIRVVLGQALDSLKLLKNEGKTFDLIFIDADKSNYLNYYKYIMDNDLLEQHGSFLIDNSLWSGEVYPQPSTPTGKAIYDFNKFVQEDERVNQIILPLNDGVMLIHRKEDEVYNL